MKERVFMRTWGRKIFKLRGIDLKLTLEAIAYLGMARIWLIIVPFRKVAGRLGNAFPAGSVVNEGVAESDTQQTTCRNVSAAVRRASKYVPFRAVCIHQAVAAKLMLRRRRIACTLHFGVGRATEGSLDKIRAHAWLDTANVKISGYPVDDGLTEIAIFV